MDPATISTLTDLVQKSGPVALFIVVWIAFKAGQTARDAVKALTDIRDMMAKNQPALERMDTTLDEIKDDLATLSRQLIPAGPPYRQSSIP